VEGCTITNTVRDGIEVTKSQTIHAQPNKKSNDNVIIGNVIDNAGENGIRVHSSDRNRISGNRVTNSSDDRTGQDGIRITSSDSITCDDNLVEQNVATDTQAKKTQAYGLNINSSLCNRTSVGTNDFAGNKTGEIKDVGTDTRYATDTDAPTTPTNLTATAASHDRIDLSWSASTDNVGVTGYHIFRDGALLASAGTETTYSDLTATPSTTYTYQVRAKDAAGNLSALSDAATVTTPPAPDTEAPTTPENLTASAVSPTRVDLSWSASTDNVAVASYEIFRDGTLLDSVGAETKYSDTTVEPSTTYSYRIRAVDSAGNASALSHPAGVTTAADTDPPTTPLNLSATAVSHSQVDLSWSSSTDNVAVTGYDIFRDGALLDTVGAQTTYSDTAVEPSTAYSYQIRARDAAANVSALSDPAAVTTPQRPDTEAPTPPENVTALAITPNRVELAWTPSSDNVGVTGYDIFRNGGLLDSMGTDTTYSDVTAEPSTTYRYQVRARDAANNLSLLSDPATVTTPPAPDTEGPTAPTNLVATAFSSTEVNLSWSGSTDNVRVTGYDIFRDGALLDSVEAETTFSDTTAGPSTSYSYQVRARDAAGNVSALSDPAIATTPGFPVFADGFETGDFSKWTANMGLVTQQQETYAGTWGARGTSAGAATWAYKHLDTTYPEVYYRIRFKVLSQGSTSNSTVHLLKVRTSSGASLLGLFRSPKGNLGYRNDVAAVSVTSSTALTTGVWHEVQIRVKVHDGSGETETWLDGVRIGPLSKTENFGTAPIGRIQLGENSTGRTYDVAFDDVVVEPGFNG
jgi:parallel beta-helix repeat protein